MAYTIIPDATDKPSTSQQQIKDNFSEIQTIIDVNHITFTGASADQGKHKKVDLTDFGSDPSLAGATKGVVYNRAYSKTGFQELYYRNNSRQGYPITGGKQSITGWAFLGGGAVMVWGTTSSDGSSDKIVTPGGTGFTSLPKLDAIYSVSALPSIALASPALDDTFVKVVSKTDAGGASSVTFRCTKMTSPTTNAKVGFYYQIIGKAQTP